MASANIPIVMDDIVLTTAPIRADILTLPPLQINLSDKIANMNASSKLKLTMQIVTSEEE
jgi:hypothetical protein